MHAPLAARRMQAVPANPHEISFFQRGLPLHTNEKKSINAHAFLSPL
jgi:hypothetical protein